MVVNVSGRTDIVAFYMDWFINRIEDGYFLVRNPFCQNIVHRIDYSDIDMFVFCTKNPSALLKNVDKITKPFVVHVTLTPYGKDFEPGVQNKNEIIEVIEKLSSIIGKDRIFIRYDPIILNDKYDLEFHLSAFRSICEKLYGKASSIIVSFVDMYKNVEKNIGVLKIRDLNEEDYAFIGTNFSKIAEDYGFTVQTCGENRTLFEYGFIQRDCVTEDLIYKYTHKTLKEKWNVRKGLNCNCVKMYDIGEYNTCKHFCKYCYANYSEHDIEYRSNMHDPDSPLLIGHLKEGDIIKNITSKY